MVPHKFTSKETQAGRQFVISRIAKTRLRGLTNFYGNPFVTYQELVTEVSDGKYHIDDEYDGMRAGILAGSISEQEHALGGPLLSALVVAADSKRPGHGFYALAGSLGMLQAQGNYDVKGAAELVFWNQQVLACVKKYGRK